MDGSNECDEITSVYVTGLCPDVHIAELKGHFSKCGIIMEDFLTGKPKIKIYRDETGVSKGDALVIYYKKESVQLAVDLLDGSYIRPDVRISVERAHFRSNRARESKHADHRVIRRTLNRLGKKLEWD